MIAMNRNERSVYSVFTDRIEAYSVIELTEIHVLKLANSKEDYNDIADEIYRLREERHKALAEEAGKKLQAKARRYGKIP